MIVKPADLTALRAKAQRIWSLAGEIPTEPDAQYFLIHVDHRRSSTYGIFRKNHPDEQERLNHIKRVVGGVIEASTLKVNGWLSRVGHPELSLTLDEFIRIGYSDKPLVTLRSKQK